MYELYVDGYIGLLLNGLKKLVKEASSDAPMTVRTEVFIFPYLIFTNVNYNKKSIKLAAS